MKRAWKIVVLCLLAALIFGDCPVASAAPKQGDIGSGGGGGSGENLGCSVAPVANPTLWRPWVGVYEDIDHGDQCVTVGLYQFLTLYVWWRPGSRGMASAEFKVDIPDDIDLFGIAPNTSVISAQSGDLETGIQVEFAECQTDWVYTHMMFGIITSSEYGIITVDPFPGADEPQLVACDGDHSTEWPFAFTLYYNDCLM